jgi:hypothetical protein
MHVPQINLDVDGAIQHFTLSNVSSSPDNQKYHVDDISDLAHYSMLKVGHVRQSKLQKLLRCMVVYFIADTSPQNVSWLK